MPVPTPTQPPPTAQQANAVFHIAGLTPIVGALIVRLVKADGSPTTASPTRVVAVRSDRSCAAPSADGSRACDVVVRAPFGARTFEFATYAAPDGTGKPLAVGTATATIGVTTAPPVEVTLNGIIASVAFDRSRVVFAADGARHSATLRWVAKDAAGSFIMLSPAVFGKAALSAINDTGNALTVSGPSDAPAVIVTYDASRTFIDATVSATLSNGLTATTEIVALRYQPVSLAVVVGGPTVALTIAEFGTAGPFTATSSSTGIAAVSASASATQPGGSATLNVAAGSQAGNATVVITDPSGVTATIVVGSSSTGSAVVIPGGLSIANFRAGISSAAVLGQIAAGPDGNIWFSEGNAIGKITPNGAVSEITGYFSTNVAGIIAGPDGNMWFTERDIDDVGTVSPTDSTVQHIALSPGDAPAGIAVGRDGALWVAESGSDRIGRVLANGINVQSYALSAGAAPAAIASGPDGNLWFTEPGINGVGRLTTVGSLTEYSTGISASAGIAGIAAGKDGNLWFTESSANRIARITPAGQVTEFAAGLSGSAAPLGIVSGIDGNLWFIESAGDRIGRITPQGVITEFPLGGSTPGWIARADDGSLWFTQNAPSALGRAHT